jgi:hypothetical protein
MAIIKARPKVRTAAGKATAAPRKKGPRKKGKQMQFPEFQVQVEFVSLMRMYYPDLLMFAVPNGGKRSIQDARRFKAMGVLAGVSDICVLEPNGVYAGLWIEFKAPGKVKQLSADQKEFGQKVLDRGFEFITFDNAVLALIYVEGYIGVEQSKRVGGKVTTQPTSA